jgi:hypothetical protein
MQHIINSDLEEYGKYSSFTFVYKCHEIKNSANIVLDLGGDPYVELC